MLIALNKCVSNEEYVKTWFKELLHEALTLSCPETSETPIDEFSIEYEEILLELWQKESKNEGPLLRMVSTVPKILFDLGDDETDLIVKIGTTIGKDMWMVYATTLNIFGGEVNTDWIFDKEKNLE